MPRFVTEDVKDIRTGEITGQITVEVMTDEEAADHTALVAQLESNELTVDQLLALALDTNNAMITTNTQAVATNDAWLAANTGNNLSTQVLTTQIKKLTQQLSAVGQQGIVAARQRNRMIRYLRRDFRGTD